MPPPVDLACVVHCHSTHSDGTGTVGEIARAAARAGADVVLLTDHDTLAARRHGEERWHGDVLVCVGEEVSPRGGNHYLAFGIDREISNRLAPADVVAAVRAAGGFGFMAHPFSRGSEPFGRAGMPWDEVDLPGATGVELWSWVTDTAEALRGARDALGFVLTPQRLVDDPPAGNLAAWDALCARRRVVAIGGIDAHQFGVRVAGRVPVRLMSYTRSFRHLRTHVLVDGPPTGDAATDRESVYRALRAGRCYLAIDSIAPARGFALSSDDAPMGAESAFRDGDVVRASVPRPASLTLLRDGEIVGRRHGTTIEHRAERPGAYRVEARLPAHGRERTWIVSNPVYLRG